MRGKVIYVPRYIFQSSALIETGKEYCLYRHYGIDVGDDKIIYFGNIEGESALESRILLANREEFSDGAEILECFRATYSYDADEIVERAYTQLGSDFDGYDLINNNCEHFARWCASGIRTSSQVFFRSDNQDIVEKAIERLFEPLVGLGSRLDEYFGLK